MGGLVARIGILGGTFDPPHLGHLILAENARDTLQLDRVLFVPVGAHPFKEGVTRSAVEDRVAMLRLAIDDNPHFTLSTIDVEREGPHFSADMVRLLKETRPDDDLYFLMGGDNLRELPTWTRPQDIYKHARIAVMRRSDEDVSAEMHADALPGLAERVDFVDTPLMSIWLSSTHIVERLQGGHSLRYLVPQPVLEYIYTHELYA